MKLEQLITAMLMVVPSLVFAQAQPTPAPGGPPAGGPPPALVSPEISADGRATFRLRAPNAIEVKVTGFTTPLAMTKDEKGVWSATTEPLAPDIYPYAFTIDGARVPDPANAGGYWASAPSGANAGTSTLAIPGVPWTNSDVAHGAVAKHVYQSPIIGVPEPYYVYTPPGYDPKRKQPYPVLVVLHGLSNNAPEWITQAGANLTLDNLIATGKAPPMILISPSAYGNAQGTRGAAAGFANFTRALLEEILPQVEKQYNASSKASERAITGLSMGAAQSLLLLNHVDKFEWIGSFSPGFDMFDPQWPAAGPRVDGQRPVLANGILERAFPALDAKVNTKLRLLYVVCGTADDHLALTRQFRDFLTARQIKLNYVEVPDAGHVWPLWRRQLAEMAQMIFKPAKRGS